MSHRLLVLFLILATFVTVLPRPCEARRPRGRTTIAVRPFVHVGPTLRHRRHVIPRWNFPFQHQTGWLYGYHGGSHWSPELGWHDMIHFGRYRPGDERVFVPLGPRNRRFRRVF